MDEDDGDLIIACCLFEILLEQKRRNERKVKPLLSNNLKRMRERRLANKRQILVKNQRRNEHLGRHSRTNIPGDSNPAKDPISTNECDEEEIYVTSKSTDIKIKVEPGLTDDTYQGGEMKDDKNDVLAGCIRLKEEPDADYMMDIDNTISIKQEDEAYLNSPLTDIQIKTEPDLSEYDESNDYAI